VTGSRSVMQTADRARPCRKTPRRVREHVVQRDWWLAPGRRFTEIPIGASSLRDAQGRTAEASSRFGGILFSRKCL
jgi:hypothetical protein